MGEILSEGDFSTRESGVSALNHQAPRASVTVTHSPLRVPTVDPIDSRSSRTQHSPIEERPFESAGADEESTPIFHDDEVSLREALGAVVCDILASGRPALLEGFGVLTSSIEAISRTFCFGSEAVRRSEKSIHITFEKCREITSYHRERFPLLVETRDIARAVHAALPLEQGLRWSEREIRTRITHFIRTVRDSVVESGFTNALAGVGDFYALHNRQGASAADRFAGADIFLRPRLQKRIQVSDASRSLRPTLENSWEILEAAYGPALCTFEIDLLSELNSLGYALSPAEQEQFLQSRALPVAVFSSRAERPTLIYATNGARSFALSHGAPSGSELIFQLPVSVVDATSIGESVPRWPARPLTLGWLLMLSARSRTVKIGAGLAAESPLIPDCDTELCAIFSTPFKPLPTEHLVQGGAFSFINIVGITGAEAEIAEKHGGGHLLTLLSHRGLDQATKPTRSSVTSRSRFEPGAR